MYASFISEFKTKEKYKSTRKARTVTVSWSSVQLGLVKERSLLKWALQKLISLEPARYSSDFTLLLTMMCLRHRP